MFPSRLAIAPVLASILAFGGSAGCESKKVPEPSAEPAPSARATPAPSPAATPSGAPEGQASNASAAQGSLDAALEAATPAGAGRFAWKPPFSVPVQEEVEQQGQRTQFAYHLDVCRGEGETVIVHHRGVHVTELNGAPTAGKEQTPELRRVEAATAVLPAMVIDRSGVFQRGTGYPEMIRHALATFPGDEFASLRQFLTSGDAPHTLDMTLAQIWQTWVGGWLAFEPSKGALQDVKDPSAGPTDSPTHMKVLGTTPEHRLKLVAERTPSQAELAKLASASAQDVAGQEVRLEWSVETEWPEIRPWVARSKRTLTVRGPGGNAQSPSEAHVYRFDWTAVGKADCKAH